MLDEASVSSPASRARSHLEAGEVGGGHSVQSGEVGEEERQVHGIEVLGGGLRPHKKPGFWGSMLDPGNEVRGCMANREGERERETDKVKQTERQMHTYVSICAYHMLAGSYLRIHEFMYCVHST